MVMAMTADITAGESETLTSIDVGLTERFARGEREAFDQIVEEYEEWVMVLAYRLLGWREDVDDVVQDVFLAVLRNLGRFRGQCGLKTYLGKVTVSKCRSYQRKLLVHRKLLVVVKSERPETAAAADQGALAAERRNELRRAIRELPRRYREVVVLRYLEEMSPGEVGEALGVSQNAVRVRLSRARKLLEVLLAEFVR